MDVWKIVQVIRNRKWTVLLTAIIACVLIMLTGDRTQDVPRYRSTAELLFNTVRASIEGDTGGGGTEAGWLGDPVVLKELMLSQDFLDKHVVPNLKAKTNWGDLRDDLDMKSLSGGNGALLVMISADDNDPKQAQALCSTVAEALTQYIPELMTREYEGNRQFIEKLVGEAKGQLDDAESSVLDWQDKHHVMTATDQYTEQTKSISNLTEERAMLQQRYAASQARLQILTSYKPGDVPPFGAIGSDGKESNISTLQASLEDEQKKLQQLRQVLKPDQQPVIDQEQVVKRLQGQLNTAIASVVASMREDVATEMTEDRSQLMSLDKSLRAMTGSISFGRDNLDFARRQRAIDLWDKNYQELVSSLYKARMREQSASRRGSITLLQTPGEGVRISGVVPKTFQKRLTIALAVSLVLGILAGLMMEYISRGMRVTTSVEEVLELRVLGTLPKLPKEVVIEWREAKTQLTRGNNGRTRTPVEK